MPSGKQLSFSFGEISPTLRFRSDAPLYSQGLYTLLNGNVRKAGGVSNRPGTLVKWVPSVQTYIPTSSLDSVGVRIFPMSLQLAGVAVDFVLLMRREYTGGSIFTAYALNTGNAADLAVNGLDAELPPNNTKFDLKTAAIVQQGNNIIVTVTEEGTSRQRTFVITYTDGFGFLNGNFIPKPAKIGTNGAGTITIFNYGLDPKDIPVSYLITQEQNDGTEVKWLSATYDKGHPHSQLTAKLSGVGLLCPELDGVKQYNVYRSAGDGTNAASFLLGVAEVSSYSLVGRIKPTPTGGSTIFSDFLTTTDITVQPPIDEYLYPEHSSANGTNIRKIVFYKQRLLVAYAAKLAGATSKYKYVEGQVGASKIGAPLMFGRPLTPNPVDAFSFTIPVDKIARITQMVAMNRLAIFTNAHTFVIRGGQNGVLSPQEVNPDTIYYEGASEDITPAVLNRSCFFIPPDKSKMNMLSFTRDDAFDCADISGLSSHFFEDRNARNLVAQVGSENKVWMLKADGKLISATISPENNVVGFSRHETNGFIEDICIQNAPTTVHAGDGGTELAPLLFLSVIRNGVRYIETMPLREDANPKKFLYADAATTFGKIKNYHEMIPFNITTATNFDAGSVLTLTDLSSGHWFSSPTWTALDPVSDLVNGAIVGKKLDFFYDIYSTTADDDGNYPAIGEGKVRLTVTAVTGVDTIQATCMEDLPTQLRNVQAQSLTAAQKLALQNRWLEAVNVVSGLTRLAGKKVSVYADSNVIANPKSSEYDILTVDNSGVLTLPDFYNWGYVGIPYEFEMETLNVEAGDNRTLTDAGKLVNSIGVGLHRTIKGFIGQTGTSVKTEMERIESREDQSIENPDSGFTGYLDVSFSSNWEKTGRVLIKQPDPLPMTVLSVYPKGVIGE